MRLRRKILLGVTAAFTLAFLALLITLSHDTPCPPVTAQVSGENSMRAVMQRCYGDPQQLRVERIAKPVPNPDQVLVKIKAASINPAEWHMTTGKPYILRLSRGIGAPEGSQRAGFDMSGIVEVVGANVTTFKPGDEVFGGANGALAEYAVVREKGAVVPKPANMSFEEAAGIPIAAITALQGLRDQGHLKAGQKVLINGASGGVGTYAVQIAKALGAEVTAVCSMRNVEMVRALGADHVVDYKQTNFTESDAKYDLILDNVGNHTYFDLLDVMQPTGIVVTIAGPKSEPFLGPMWRVIRSKFVGMFAEQELPFFIASVNKADLELLAGLVRDGKMRTVIDTRYPLEQAGDALAYLGGQHARGKVIITVQ
jgi:NADPH:quinone reductase-like Zn-dependent oxidoreductase